MSKASASTTEPGSAKLHRSHLFNKFEDDIDVPDGDVGYGHQLYKELCASCHDHKNEGPNLTNIFGAQPGRQEFSRYSQKCKSGSRWSKQQLFKMLEDPQMFFGLESPMLFGGLSDPYMRASIIQYLMYTRINGGKGLKSYVME